MTPKPDFERLRTALTCGGEPDRVPLAELIVSGEVAAAFMGRAIDTPELAAEFYKRAGYDYLRVTPIYPWNPSGKPPREGVRTGKAKYSLYAEDETELNWAAEGLGVITSMEDFEGFDWFPVEDVDYSCFDTANRTLPEGMKIIGHQGDIFRQVTELMGFEGFAYATADDPELVGAMFQKAGEIEYEIFKNIADQENVEALWYSDDIAYTEGLLASPTLLRKHCFPWFRKIGLLAKRKGIPYIYHSDGDLWEVMEDLIDDIGFNALQPIEPKAMDIRECKEKIGDRVCLIGNVDLGYTLTRGTPEEVREEVRCLIRDIAPGGGYCVGSSNTVPSYVPLENYRAMIDATFEFGEYPVRVDG